MDESRSLDIAFAVLPTIAAITESKNTVTAPQVPVYVGIPTDLSSYDIKWDSLAGQRAVSIYHMHTLVMPVIDDVLNLINGSHSNRSRSQIKAKILNRLIRGGSPFGQQKILAQKIRIAAYSAIYSEEYVSNLTIGKKGKRKSHGYQGQISKSHSFLAYHVASEADKVLTFYDARLNRFFSSLIVLDYIVYENSVMHYICFDRSHHFNEIKQIINELTENK